MKMPPNPNFTQIAMSDQEFALFADFIYAKCAIKLPPVKKTMLTSRLNRRLKTLNLTSYSAYYKLVSRSTEGSQELIQLINEVSTNKTDFFREPAHFTFITSRILADFEQKTHGNHRTFRVWSAGCSSGEEPYTLAMVLEDFKSKNHWLKYSIVATDVSTKVLTIAEKGIYQNDRMGGISAYYRTKYTLRGKGKNAGRHLMAPELCQQIEFKRLNFTTPSFNIFKRKFDLILCRNVIIYFDIETQEKLFNKFYQQLLPGGHIMIGHSETMPGMGGKMQRVSPAVYQDIQR